MILTKAAEKSLVTLMKSFFKEINNDVEMLLFDKNSQMVTVISRFSTVNLKNIQFDFDGKITQNRELSLRLTNVVEFEEFLSIVKDFAVNREIMVSEIGVSATEFPLLAFSASSRPDTFNNQRKCTQLHFDGVGFRYDIDKFVQFEEITCSENVILRLPADMVKLTNASTLLTKITVQKLKTQNVCKFFMIRKFSKDFRIDLEVEFLNHAAVVDLE